MPKTRRHRLRAETKFASHFKLIWAVQTLVQEYFYFFFSEIAASSSAFRSDARGVRVVTNVERNAVDADVPTDERQHLRTAKSCGPGAPMQAPRFAEREFCETDGGKRWFTGESSK